MPKFQTSVRPVATRWVVNPEQGFSIVEVLVGFSLLTLLSAGVGQLFVQMHRNTRGAEQRASNVADNLVLAQLIAKRGPEICAGLGLGGATLLPTVEQANAFKQYLAQPPVPAAGIAPVAGPPPEVEAFFRERSLDEVPPLPELLRDSPGMPRKVALDLNAFHCTGTADARECRIDMLFKGTSTFTAMAASRYGLLLRADKDNRISQCEFDLSGVSLRTACLALGGEFAEGVCSRKLEVCPSGKVLRGYGPEGMICESVNPITDGGPGGVTNTVNSTTNTVNSTTTNSTTVTQTVRDLYVHRYVNVLGASEQYVGQQVFISCTRTDAAAYCAQRGQVFVSTTCVNVGANTILGYNYASGKWTTDDHFKVGGPNRALSEVKCADGTEDAFGDVTLTLDGRNP